MDAVVGLWIASVVGAACFGAAGFFLARVLAEKEAASKPAEQPSPALPPPDERETPPEPQPMVVRDEAAIAAAVEEAEAKARRQLDALREELRVELLARTEAEKRAADLASRLVSSGQQVAALRAKLQAAEEARRSLAPPARHATSPPPRVSERPPNPRMQSLAPGLFSEIEELRREIARLTAENRHLRSAAGLGKRGD